ncbi:hypothetical protein XENORESO_021208 [Xenotaenia resolanae]|uniref:Uncharacterized protein n=1 Tax=Xenotaenia resolanae TaxID=208358 RepID=A0ABV0WHV3_9TELE
MRYGAPFGIFPTIRIKSIEMTRHLPHFHLVLQLYSSQLKPSLSHSLFSAQSVKIICCRHLVVIYVCLLPVLKVQHPSCYVIQDMQQQSRPLMLSFITAVIMSTSREFDKYNRESTEKLPLQASRSSMSPDTEVDSGPAELGDASRFSHQKPASSSH